MDNQQPVKTTVVPLILGIIAILSNLFLALVGIALSVIGIILGKKALNRGDLKAKPGYIVSCVALGISVVNAIVGAILGVMRAMG